MKRFHIHIAVDNLAESIDFYSKLFGNDPTHEKVDYAKWILDEPGLNFAISSRGYISGINHLGFQADTEEELDSLKQHAESASNNEMISQDNATCCYAHSKKYWTIDPQGLAWEHFHTMSDSLEFGDDGTSQMDACCIPVRTPEKSNRQANDKCCIPNPDSSTPCCSG